MSRPNTGQRLWNAAKDRGNRLVRDAKNAPEGAHRLFGRGGNLERGTREVGKDIAAAPGVALRATGRAAGNQLKSWGESLAGASSEGGSRTAQPKPRPSGGGGGGGKMRMKGRPEPRKARNRAEAARKAAITRKMNGGGAKGPPKPPRR